MQEINEQALLQWWDIFKKGNPLVEVRLIGSNKTASGYFSDVETLIKQINPLSQDYNIYFTLNPIKPECYGREQKDKIVLKPKNTTKDNEILCRDWVLIDVDCNRVAGVNATSKEAQYAYAKAEQVEKMTVRSTSNTTAEKKAAADRAAKAQAAPQNSGENKKPNHHHRRPHRRPRGKGGNNGGGAKQGE